ncbi:unnamed protein product [Calypogeia fissa]
MESNLDHDGRSLSDEEYAIVWSDLWEQEDDVAFSSPASLDRELHGSNQVLDDIHSSGRVPCVALSSGGDAAPWWNSLMVGPAFQAPFVARHLPAVEFHEQLIVSQIIGHLVVILAYWAGV